MQLKRVLLASSALALLAGAGSAHAGDMYISVLGGANWQADSSGAVVTPTSSSFNVDPDTGFVVGGAVGAKLDQWLNGLRAEIEVAYRRNDLSGSFSTSSGSTGGVLNLNSSNFSVMANVWYDIDMGWKIKPYVGGGAGWVRSKVNGAAVTTFTSGGSTTGLFTTFNATASGFAWQLGLGFNYEAAPGVDVGVGYRYFEGQDFAPFFLGFGRLENQNHSVLVNLTIDVN
jgi:opacity protein-like surface antigen